jgi:topoisomerase-4 subunit A
VLRLPDKNTLVITQIPFSTNTTTLIDSILKANEKGKIKIKKIEDNTAASRDIDSFISWCITR